MSEDKEVDAYEEALKEQKKNAKKLVKNTELVSDTRRALYACELEQTRLYNLSRTLEFKVARARVDSQVFEVGCWYQREQYSYNAKEGRTKELANNPEELIYVVSSKCPRKYPQLTLYHLQLASVRNWNQGKNDERPIGWYTSFINISQQKMRLRTDVWHKLPSGSKLQMVIKGGVPTEKLLNVCTEAYEDTKPRKVLYQLDGVAIGTWEQKEETPIAFQRTRITQELVYFQPWRFVTPHSIYNEEETVSAFKEKGVWAQNPRHIFHSYHVNSPKQEEPGEWNGLYPIYPTDPDESDGLW